MQVHRLCIKNLQVRLLLMAVDLWPLFVASLRVVDSVSSPLGEAKNQGAVFVAVKEIY